jgi:two-component system cell cycle sensor histidine kinase/response regulator CckA
MFGTAGLRPPAGLPLRRERGVLLSVGRQVRMSAWYTAGSAKSEPVSTESFPVRPGAAPAPGAGGDTPAPRSRGGERILLVDDEEVLRRLARAVLLRHGYEVIDAAGPVAALDLAAEQPGTFQLILADVMMPTMNGHELVERMRPHQPRARVLYMSGYAGEVDGSSELLTPFLEKPFRPRQLLEAIRVVLDAPPDGVT